MAFNLKEMTIDYKKLFKMVPSERAAVAESGLINDLVSALTPGQLVNLFPRYYREKLPDVGRVNQYSSRLDVALSGGTDIRYRNRNSNYAPGPTVDEMKADLLKKGIDVDNTYETVGSGILEGDPRVKYMKAIPTDQLAEFGFTRVNDENGKTLIKAIPTKSSQMSDQEISNLISGTNVATENAGEKQRAILREANRLGVDPSDLATVISYETIGTFDPNIMGGKGGKYKGLIQFGPEEQAKYLKPGMTFDEQMVAVGNFLEDRGYKRWLKENPNASLMEKRTALYSTINAGSPDQKYWGRSDNGKDNIMTHTQRMFSDDNKNRELATGLMKDSYKKVDGNATPEQIAAARRDMENQEKSYNESRLAKTVYENQNKYYNTATLIENGPIPSGTSNREAVGGQRTIALTENKNGQRILNRLDWMAEQASKKTGEKITYEIFSALQPPGKNDYERGGAGTGGYRHGTDVGAADVRWVAEDKDGNKRYITANSEGDDAKLMGNILELAGAAGFTGIGIGREYQGGHTHLGFGSEQLWNSAASGDAMRPEFAQYVMRGKQKAKEEGFEFDPYYEERLRRWQEDQQAKREAAKPTPPPPAPSIMPTETRVDAMSMPALVQPESITPKPSTEPNIESVMPQQTANQPAVPPAIPVEKSQFDPNMYYDMASGANKLPPSQYRAFNNARLYDPQSTKLYNGHFA